jgi:hypothetical protein
MTVAATGYHAAVHFPRTDERIGLRIVNAIAGDGTPCSEGIAIHGFAPGWAELGN